MRHLGSMTLEYALHSNYVNEIWIVILTLFQCTFYAVFTYVPYRRIVLKIVCLYRNAEYIGKKTPSGSVIQVMLVYFGISDSQALWNLGCMKM